MPVVLTDSEYAELIKSKASPSSKSKVKKPCPPGKKRSPETKRCRKVKRPYNRKTGQPTAEQIAAARDSVRKRTEKKQKKTEEQEVKPKRPLNAYQQFMSETILMLKRAYPQDSAKERFSTAVKLWKEHKVEQAGFDEE